MPPLTVQETNSSEIIKDWPQTITSSTPSGTIRVQVHRRYSQLPCRVRDRKRLISLSAAIHPYTFVESERDRRLPAP